MKRIAPPRRWARRARVMASGLVFASACAVATSPPPPANPGAKYVAAGDNPNYDSGCEQDRGADGKIVRGQSFELVSERNGCWLIMFEDETETYIKPIRVKNAK